MAWAFKLVYASVAESTFGGGAYQIKVALFALYHSKKGASMFIPLGLAIKDAGSTKEKVNFVEFYLLIYSISTKKMYVPFLFG